MGIRQVLFSALVCGWTAASGAAQWSGMRRDGPPPDAAGAAPALLQAASELSCPLPQANPSPAGLLPDSRTARPLSNSRRRDPVIGASFNADAPEGGAAAPNSAPSRASAIAPDAGQDQQGDRTAPPPASAAPAPLRLAPPGPGGAARSAEASARRGGLHTALTVASSLALVLGLFFVLAWVFRRAGLPHGGQLPREAFEVLGRATLVGRQQVCLVRLGAKLVLVAVRTDGIETLSEVSEPAEVARLIGLCGRGGGAQGFADLVRHFSAGGGRA